jgi:hypothetical protein
MQSLIDTGSTHCLISVESFKKLGLTCYKPISMLLKVAVSLLKKNNQVYWYPVQVPCSTSGSLGGVVVALHNDNSDDTINISWELLY